MNSVSVLVSYQATFVLLFDCLHQKQKYLTAFPAHVEISNPQACLVTVKLRGRGRRFLFSCSEFWPLKHIFRWSGRETRTLSTQRATPIFSSRPTIISSSKKPGWRTRATTRVWPKTSSLAAKATLPRSWSMVGDNFFQQVSTTIKLCTRRLMRGLGSYVPRASKYTNTRTAQINHVLNHACMLLPLSHISTLTSACSRAWQVTGCTSAIRWL